MGEAGLDRHEARAATVHRQLGAACQTTRVRLRVDPACRECLDLGEIADVGHVDSMTCDFGPAEPVDGEFAEWLLRRSDLIRYCRSERHEEHGTLHAAYPFA